MIKKVFKVEKLFESKSIKKMLSRSDCIENGIYPVCSSDTNNNGIIGYYNNPEFIIDAENPVYITFGDHTRTLNIMQQSFSVIDNIKVLKPKIHNINVLLYIITVWKKQIKDLGYARHWKIAKNCELNLPILLDKYNKPVFDCKKEYHNEGYIPDTEYMAKRISELEDERISELTAYLKVSGLENYKLTKEEEEAIDKINNKKVKFEKFSINEIFDIATGKDFIIGNTEKGDIPLISHTNENNGLVANIKVVNNRRIFDAKKTIALADRGVFYATTQNKNFHIGTRVKALTFKEGVKSEEERLFVTSSINRLQVLFTDYLTNATDKLPNLQIELPTINNKIDYGFMKTYIKAIEKLVIKNVVDWRDKQISAAKQIVNTK